MFLHKGAQMKAARDREGVDKKGANQQLLFHGTSLDIVEKIV